MDNLKPCPFCGCEADLSNVSVETKDGKKLWSVECTDCGVILDRVTKEEAVEAWNHRVISDLISKHAEKYRDEDAYRAVKQREEEKDVLYSVASNFEDIYENWDEIKEVYVYGQM